MKIDLTQEEYRSLVDLLSLAGCMLEGYGRGEDPRKTACFKVEQMLLSYAEDAGCPSLTERNADSGIYLRKWSKDRGEEVIKWLDQYNDDCFWQELIIRMAERDFKSLLYLEPTDEQDTVDEEKALRLAELENHYEEEFVANGLDNLALRNEVGEGMN
ncbi:MAG: hypothetical protein VCA36_13770 [Opitutales bacterium]